MPSQATAKPPPQWKVTAKEQRYVDIESSTIRASVTAEEQRYVDILLETIYI
jgi:hypothetical protein